MIHELDAIYENGVLRPLEPLALGERQRVHLTLDDESSPRIGAIHARINDRREEMAWLISDAAPYAGQWVALNGGSLVAHGMDAASVRAAARAAGVERPLLTHLPANRELPFGGW